MGGMPGRIMWMIPAMVVLVLIFSLIESFCVLPAHMSSLKTSGNTSSRKNHNAMIALGAN